MQLMTAWNRYQYHPSLPPDSTFSHIFFWGSLWCLIPGTLFPLHILLLTLEEELFQHLVQWLLQIRGSERRCRCWYSSCRSPRASLPLPRQYIPDTHCAKVIFTQPVATVSQSVNLNCNNMIDQCNSGKLMQQLKAKTSSFMLILNSPHQGHLRTSCNSRLRLPKDLGEHCACNIIWSCNIRLFESLLKMEVPITAVSSSDNCLVWNEGAGAHERPTAPATRDQDQMREFSWKSFDNTKPWTLWRKHQPGSASVPP